MTATIHQPASDGLFVLGETLRPLLTNASGAALEIFDTSGPAGSGPPPHRHPWEEVYVVLAGGLEVTVVGRDPQVLAVGAVAHVPADAVHGYRNLTDDTRFLTITTKGNAARFFTEVATQVAMNPPDIPGVIRVGASHGIEFVG